MSKKLIVQDVTKNRVHGEAILWGTDAVSRRKKRLTTALGLEWLRQSDRDR